MTDFIFKTFHKRCLDALSHWIKVNFPPHSTAWRKYVPDDKYFDGYIWISVEKYFLLENTYIGTIEASKEDFQKRFHVNMDFLVSPHVT